MTDDRVLLIRAEAGALDGANIFARACELFAKDRGVSLSNAGKYISEKFPEFHKRHFRGQ